MRKALDVALVTDSYDELIGMFHGFILDKQRNLESNTNPEDVEYNIKNPIITKRKGRPPGRAKCAVEIQDQQSNRDRNLQPLEVSNQISNEANNGTIEKDKRKTCQKCGIKGHNRATCKSYDFA